LCAGLTSSRQTGTEIFQRLESKASNNTTNNHWITYAELDKYHHNQTTAQLAYAWYKLQSEWIRQWGYHLHAKYTHDNETIQESDLTRKQYQNLFLSAEAERSLAIKKAWFTIKAGLGYNLNLQKQISNLPATFFSRNSIIPDFDYITAKRFTGHLSATYEREITSANIRCFTTGAYQLHSSNNLPQSPQRHWFNLTVGFIW